MRMRLLQEERWRAIQGHSGEGAWRVPLAYVVLFLCIPSGISKCLKRKFKKIIHKTVFLQKETRECKQSPSHRREARRVRSRKK